MATRNGYVDEIQKSMITDHAVQESHVIDWKEAKVIDKGSKYKPVGYEKPPGLERAVQVSNRAQGAYSLSHGYEHLLHSGNENKNTTRGDAVVAYQ